MGTAVHSLRANSTLPMLALRRAIDSISLPQPLHFLKEKKTQQFIEYAAMIAISHFLWTTLMISLNIEGPLVVVISGSMEPHFYRGDVLFSTNLRKEFQVGDIVSFRIKNRDIPIVHRIIKVWEEKGEKAYLTKGDNNQFDDRGLYPPKMNFITAKDIIGTPVVVIPYIGYFNILISEYPIMKLLLLAAVGIEALM